VHIYKYIVPDIAASSLSTHESLWTEIPCYTVFQCTLVFDTPPQIVVNKQWQYVKDWLQLRNFLVTLILIRNYNYCLSTFVFCASMVPPVRRKTVEAWSLWRPAWCIFIQCPILQEMDSFKNCLRHQYSHSWLTHSYKCIIFCFQLEILVWVFLNKLKFM